MEKKIIQTTVQLMRFQSVKDNYQEKKAIIQYVGKLFSGTGLVLRYFEKNQNPSLVITTNRRLHQKIFLNGHLDVVPAEKSDFGLKVEKNKLFGRGSGDMKTACAVMIETMKLFSKKRRCFSLGLMLTTDEEVGGKDGVGFLLKEKGFSSDLAIIPDGGKGLNEIILKQKGVLQLKITAKGKAAHGAHPFLGKNAVEKVLEDYFKIRKNFSNVRTGQWKNTLNLGKISGGEAVNKVPDSAEMFLDIRYIQKADRKKLIERLKQIKCSFSVIGEGNPFIQGRHSGISLFKKIVEQKTKKQVRYSKVEGASDGRYFSEKGIPTVITKIKAGNIHGQNEWVDRKEIILFQEALSEFINKFN